MILVGCEKSGRLREALRRRGYDAWSCDILPSEDGSPHHIQDDVRKVAKSRAWKKAFMFPECTFMSLSSAKHLYLNAGKKEPLVRNEPRWQKMREAAAFKKELLQLPYPVISENPWMLKEAQKLLLPFKWFCSTNLYDHGECSTKRTFFWTNSGIFKPLEKTQPLALPPKDSPERRGWEKVFREPPGPNRKANRSRLAIGLAEAMAEQWGAA